MIFLFILYIIILIYLIKEIIKTKKSIEFLSKVKKQNDIQFKTIEDIAAEKKKQIDKYRIEEQKLKERIEESKNICEVINEDIEINSIIKQKLLNAIEELKNTQKIIIEQQKIEEQNRILENYNKIILSENDIKEIKILQDNVEPLIKNKEILNKLIYEMYYKKPMTDMFGRVKKRDKPCGIYKITNTVNKKAYIGKSVEIIPKRWTEHVKSSLNIGTISHSKIHDAIKEYGIQNFTFEILEECDKNKLGEREKFWISFYETNNYGYNIKSGG